MQDRILIIVGAMLFFPILYYVVRAAVEEGTFNALMACEKLKNDKDKNE